MNEFSLAFFSSSRRHVLRFHVSWAGHFVAGPWVFRLQGVAGQQVFGSALEIFVEGSSPDVFLKGTVPLVSNRIEDSV